MKITFSEHQFDVRKNEDNLYSLKDIENGWKESGGKGKRLDNWKSSPQFKTLSLQEDFRVDSVEGGALHKQGTWGSELALEKYIEYLKGCSPRHHSYSLREDAALKTIEQALNVDLHRQYPCGKYKIDGYDAVNNIAYEIDENHHRFQQEADKERQSYIMNRLGCTFVRIKL